MLDEDDVSVLDILSHSKQPLTGSAAMVPDVQSYSPESKHNIDLVKLIFGMVMAVTSLMEGRGSSEIKMGYF